MSRGWSGFAVPSCSNIQRYFLPFKLLLGFPRKLVDSGCWFRFIDRWSYRIIHIVIIFSITLGFLQIFQLARPKEERGRSKSSSLRGQTHARHSTMNSFAPSWNSKQSLHRCNAGTTTTNKTTTTRTVGTMVGDEARHRGSCTTHLATHTRLSDVRCFIYNLFISSCVQPFVVRACYEVPRGSFLAKSRSFNFLENRCKFSLSLALSLLTIRSFRRVDERRNATALLWIT